MEEIEEFWPVQAEIPAWLCGSFSSGGGSSAVKSLEALPGLLFVRARMVCTSQAVLWCLVRTGIGGDVRRALCLLPGRLRKMEMS